MDKLNILIPDKYKFWKSGSETQHQNNLPRIDLFSHQVQEAFHDGDKSKRRRALRLLGSDYAEILDRGKAGLPLLAHRMISNVTASAAALSNKEESDAMAKVTEISFPAFAIAKRAFFSDTSDELTEETNTWLSGIDTTTLRRDINRFWRNHVTEYADGPDGGFTVYSEIDIPPKKEFTTGETFEGYAIETEEDKEFLQSLSEFADRSYLFLSMLHNEETLPKDKTFHFQKPRGEAGGDYGSYYDERGNLIPQETFTRLMLTTNWRWRHEPAKEGERTPHFIYHQLLADMSKDEARKSANAAQIVLPENLLLSSDHRQKIEQIEAEQKSIAVSFCFDPNSPVLVKGNYGIWHHVASMRGIKSVDKKSALRIELTPHHPIADGDRALKKWLTNIMTGKPQETTSTPTDNKKPFTTEPLTVPHQALRAVGNHKYKMLSSRSGSARDEQVLTDKGMDLLGEKKTLDIPVIAATCRTKGLSEKERNALTQHWKEKGVEILQKQHAHEKEKFIRRMKNILPPEHQVYTYLQYIEDHKTDPGVQSYIDATYTVCCKELANIMLYVSTDTEAFLLLRPFLDRVAPTLALMSIAKLEAKEQLLLPTLHHLRRGETTPISVKPGNIDLDVMTKERESYVEEVFNAQENEITTLSTLEKIIGMKGPIGTITAAIGSHWPGEDTKGANALARMIRMMYGTGFEIHNEQLQNPGFRATTLNALTLTYVRQKGSADIIFDASLNPKTPEGKLIVWRLLLGVAKKYNLLPDDLKKKDVLQQLATETVKHAEHAQREIRDQTISFRTIQQLTKTLLPDVPVDTTDAERELQQVMKESLEEMVTEQDTNPFTKESNLQLIRKNPSRFIQVVMSAPKSCADFFLKMLDKGAGWMFAERQDFDEMFQEILTHTDAQNILRRELHRLLEEYTDASQIILKKYIRNFSTVQNPM